MLIIFSLSNIYWCSICALNTLWLRVGMFSFQHCFDWFAWKTACLMTKPRKRRRASSSSTSVHLPSVLNRDSLVMVARPVLFCVWQREKSLGPRTSLNFTCKGSHLEYLPFRVYKICFSQKKVKLSEITFSATSCVGGYSCFIFFPGIVTNVNWPVYKSISLSLKR